MLEKITDKLNNHIKFTYSSFDRVVFRGYIRGLFREGGVINLLRNLGFRNHSNGVIKTLTDQLNSHIKKTAEKLGVVIHWWGNSEKAKYAHKLDLVEDVYRKELKKKHPKSKVICIIKSLENTRTFANKTITTKAGKFRITSYNVCYTKLLRENSGKVRSSYPLVGQFRKGKICT